MRKTQSLMGFGVSVLNRFWFVASENKKKHFVFLLLCSV